MNGDLKVAFDRVLRATKFRRWLIHLWKPMTQARVRQGIDGVRSLYQRENRLEGKVALESMRDVPKTIAAVATLDIDAEPVIQVNTFGYKIPQLKLRRLPP